MARKTCESPPKPDIEAAISALMAQAAMGNMKAIVALTDGRLDRLKAMAAGATTELTPRHAVRGETRTECPNCRHRLLVSYDTVQGWAELHITDLTTMLDRDPDRRKEQSNTIELKP